jgi:hypothetical protein
MGYYLLVGSGLGTLRAPILPVLGPLARHSITAFLGPTMQLQVAL